MRLFQTYTRRCKKGFTLVEVSASVVIMTLALGLAIGGFMFALKNTNENDVQSELDIDVQLAMERLKRDLRLSSLDKIFFYPQGPGPYTALSFPLAEDSDDDGLIELDSDGKIIWDKTVIYHVYPGSPDELRVTTFANRDNELSDALRQAQLDHVVINGNGSNTSNGNNASTKVIFENLLNWKIQQESGVFDTYAPELTRDRTDFGFVLLDNGSHTFKFTIVGKNSDSSGYKFGLDQLVVSPSGEREAEAQLPVTAQSGATAVSRYMAGGSWEGNHQLFFPATAKNQSFTLTMDNDRWEETNFEDYNSLHEKTEVAFDKTSSPKDFVIQLLGREVAWEAEQQTSSKASAPNNTFLQGETVFVHLNGSALSNNGNCIAYEGRKCRLTFQAGSTGRLQVSDVRIGAIPPTTDSVQWITPPDGFVDAKFKDSSGVSSIRSRVMNTNQTHTTEWIDLSINPTNNYLVAFTVENDANTCFPAAWANADSGFENYCLLKSTGTKTNQIYGLAALETSYPEQGTYTSEIYDTRTDTPKFQQIKWNAELPSGTTLLTKIRSGDKDDLSDAPSWDSLSGSAVSGRSVEASYKRYIQVQAILTSSSDGLSTPKLKDFTIDWPGDLSLVNIGGIVTMGPDQGIVQLTVDGTPIQSALTIGLEIYKNIFSFKGKAKRISSSLDTEIRPRNTGY